MNSFIGWVGGKKLLRKEVCARFPGKVDKYVEVFGGAAWVLFYKDKHAGFEVYNDINSQLVNLFKCIKYHPEAVAQEIWFLLNSRELFNCFKNQDINALTDIQKAARYFYLVKVSYGSKVTTYGAIPKNLNPLDEFKEVHERLKRVVVENKSFDMLIKQYDGANTLFYCDPPYYQIEKYYDTGNFIFDEAQHMRLKEILSQVKGKFVLSYNDCLFIRELYSGFSVEAVERHNNMASRYSQGSHYKELIIKNY